MLLLCSSVLLLYPGHLQNVKRRPVRKGKQKYGHSSNTTRRKYGNDDESEDESEDDISYEAKSVKDVDDLFTETSGISWQFNFTDLWSSQSLPTSMTTLHSDKTVISFEDGRVRVLLMHISGDGILLNENPSILFDFQSNIDRRLSVSVTHICPWEVHTEHSSSFEIICCIAKNVLTHWRLEIKKKIKLVPNRNSEECSVESSNNNSFSAAPNPMLQSSRRIIFQKNVQRYFSSNNSIESEERKSTEHVAGGEYEMLAVNLGVSGVTTTHGVTVI